MVLYAHAERVHQDGDHDAPVEVFAVHDPLQLVPEASPQQHHPVLGFVRVPVTPPAAPATPRPQLRPLVGGRYVGVLMSEAPTWLNIVHRANKTRATFCAVSVLDLSCGLYIWFVLSRLITFSLSFSSSLFHLFQSY